MSLEFYIYQMDISTNIANPTLNGFVTIPFTADATAEFDVSAVVLRKLFQFHTDGIDADDTVANDLKYRVLYTNGALLTADFVANSTITTGSITGVNNVKLDYEHVCFMANSIFGTVNGINLFSNELPLRTSLIDNGNTTLNSKLFELGLLGIIDSSSNSLNPSRAILKQIISSKPERLNPLHTVITEDAISNYNFNYMPINVGDVLYFKMVVLPPTVQLSDLPAVPVRTYLMKINVVGPDVWPTTEGVGGGAP